MSRILVIEDSLVVLELIKEWLTENYEKEIVIANNVSEALYILKATRFDLIICDYEMPGGNGGEVLHYLKENSFADPFILFTGRFDIKLEIKKPLIAHIDDKDYAKLFELIKKCFDH